jgi:hypothetical protein
MEADALVDFCKFFLEISIDQIDFMAKLLNLNSLLERVSDHINLEIQKDHLPKGSYSLLKEALITGSFERGQAAGDCCQSQRVNTDKYLR